MLRVQDATCASCLRPLEIRCLYQRYPGDNNRNFNLVLRPHEHWMREREEAEVDQAGERFRELCRERKGSQINLTMRVIFWQREA